MKKLFFPISLALTILILPIAALGQKAQPERIYFKKGARETYVYGEMNGYRDRKTYIIRVRKGQTMSINNETDNNYGTVSLEIADPRGEDATNASVNCNSNKTVSPTRAGDYTINVRECQKVDEWKGKFKLKVTVK